MDTLFIADVHLSDERPDKLSLFQQFMRGPARQAGALYILGDLFENFWLGNDDRRSPNPAVLAELQAYSAAGLPLFIVRGNRDLLLDRGIEPLTGARLLPDLTVIDLDGQRVLIAHGDILCTRDIKYQRFRRIAEAFPVRWTFLHMPYAWRERFVRGVNPSFKESTARKRPEITDVDGDTVIRTMREYGVRELIHGHTHRPGLHELTIDGEPARRIVLGDWYDKELILVCRGTERKLMSVADYIDSIKID